MLNKIKLLRNNFSTIKNNPFLFNAIMNKNVIREWKNMDENLLKLRCYDTLYVHTIGDENKPLAVDPEGGPFINVGQKFEIDGKTVEIEEILSINHVKVIDIIFKAKPIEN